MHGESPGAERRNEFSGHFGGDAVAGNKIGHGDEITVTPDVAHDVTGLENPYLGLRAFTYDDRASFAGREQAVDEALTLLTEPGSPRTLLFVTGASGSGKSSFGQAGVLPALESYYRERDFAVPKPVAFRPLKHPLAMLADALVRLGLPQRLLQDPQAVIGTPSDFAAFVCDGTPADQINLIVVDQFEELFTQAEPPERGRLIAILSALPPFLELRTHVMATLRSDFLGELFDYPELFDLATHGIKLRTMSVNELRESIERPLSITARDDERYRGKTWGPGLVQKLATEASASATYLPLLQITLQELWRRGHLTLATYEEMNGTLTGAIGNRATTVVEFADFDRSQPSLPRPEADQQTIMQLFLDLVQVSVEAAARRDSRRRRTREALVGGPAGPETAEPERQLEDLVRARLLSVKSEHEVDYVDIIHESLIANWDRLQQAIGAERLALQQRARFEQSLAEWRDNDQSDDYLLTGVRLTVARVLHERQDVALSDPLAREFFARSPARDEEVQQRALEGERRRADEAARQARKLEAALDQAQKAQLRAEREAGIALSRQLAMQAHNELNDHFDLALLLSAEASRIADMVEARSSLIDALQYHANLTLLFHGHRDSVNALAFSPDATVLVSAGLDARLIFWDVATGQALAGRGTPVTGPIMSLAISPDGEIVATADTRRQVVLWDMHSRQPLGPPLVGHTWGVQAVAFSPAGRVIASGSGDWNDAAKRLNRGEIRLWDAYTGKQIGAVLYAHADFVQTLTFSPDGSRLATGGGDGRIVLWDTRTAEPLGHPLEGHVRAVRCLAFSPDGAVLASGGVDGVINLWDTTASPSAGVALATIRRGVNGLVFSSDGRTLISTGGNRFLVIWNVKRRQWLNTLLGGADDRSRDPLNAVALSSDGTLLASGGGRSTTGGGDGRDTSISLWDLAASSPLERRLALTEHTGTVTSSALSPDGTILVSGGDKDDMTIILRHLVTGEPLGRPLRLHTSAVTGLSFSPDGALLASAGGAHDARVMLWDVVTMTPLGSPWPSGAADSVVHGLTFSPDGKVLASGGCARTSRLLCDQGEVRLWDVASGQLIGTPLIGHRGAVSSLVFSPDGRLLISADDSPRPTIVLWDIATWRPVGQPLAADWLGVSSPALSPDATLLACANAIKQVIVLWSLPGGKRTGELRGKPATALTFSPDGSTLAAGSPNGLVSLWDVATAQLSGPPITVGSRVVNLSFTTDGKTLVAVGSDGVAVLRDTAVDS